MRPRFAPAIAVGMRSRRLTHSGVVERLSAAEARLLLRDAASDIHFWQLAMPRLTLDQRCRIAFLTGIHDHELRSGRPLTADELRRALARYPVVTPGDGRPNEKVRTTFPLTGSTGASCRSPRIWALGASVHEGARAVGRRGVNGAGAGVARSSCARVASGNRVDRHTLTGPRGGRRCARSPRAVRQLPRPHDADRAVRGGSPWPLTEPTHPVRRRDDLPVDVVTATADQTPCVYLPLDDDTARMDSRTL